MNVQPQLIIRPRVPKLAQLSAYWVLAICVAVSAASFFFLQWSLRNDGQRRFDMVQRQVQARILTRLERYENALIQTRAHFLNSTSSYTRENFRNYVEHLALLEKYPGIQGLGFAVRIPRAQLEKHTREVRAQGYPSYRVWPEDPRTEYFSTVLIEPFDWRNQRAFGYDMSTDAVRREAMDRARDSGYPATTAKVTLVQETMDERREGPQPGFVIFAPVYRGGEVPATIEGRRERLSGFIFSPFRTHGLFEAIFQRDLEDTNVDIEVFDGPTPTRENQIFDLDGVSQLDGASHARDFQATSTIELPGRQWTLSVRTTDGFESPLSSALPWMALLVGILVSILFFRIVRGAQEHSRREANTRRTLELINQVGRKISGELELDRLVQAVVETAAQLIHAEFGAFTYTGIGTDGETRNLCAFAGKAPENWGKEGGISPGHVPYKRSGDLRLESATQEFFPFADAVPGTEKNEPAVSYLSVPVVSRSGESIGGLFFTHSEARKFSERDEQIVVGLSAQAAVGIDNARLFQKAQEAIAVRDEFLSICSHELKTPLTSLKLQTQMYRRKLRSGDPSSMAPERMEKLTETSERQIERLTRLVEDMLDIARITSGRMVMRPEMVELYPLVAESIERISPQAVAAHCTISLKGPGRRIVGTWDRIRVEQVVANLLSNSIKYGARMPIDVSIAEEEEEAVIRVRDYGMGIDKSNQAKIFERFERAVSASNISGLGLGLYIVRQILEAHDGRIEVQSELGHGATFTVRLPLHPKMGVRPGLSDGAPSAEDGASPATLDN